MARVLSLVLIVCALAVFSAAAPIAMRRARSQSGTKTQKRACLFLHGVGGAGPAKLFGTVKVGTAELATPEEIDKKVESLKNIPYWNAKYAVANGLSGVCDLFYYKTDTINRGWDHAELQKEYCNAIADVSDYYFEVAVFTHSMGNLITAGGIANKVTGCDRIDQTGDYNNGQTVRWFGIQPPLRGAESATFTKDVANGKFKPKLNSDSSLLNGLGNGFDKVGENVYDKRVDFSGSRLFKTYKAELKGGYVTLETAYRSKTNDNENVLQLDCTGKTGKGYNCREVNDVANQYMAGLTCGVNPKGMGSMTKKKFGQTIDIGQHLGEWMQAWAKSKGKNQVKFFDDWDKLQNDGMVPLGSCRTTTYDTNVQSTAKGLFYAAAVNHGEGPGASGDSDSDDAAKPFSWIKFCAENMMKVKDMIK